MADGRRVRLFAWGYSLWPRPLGCRNRINGGINIDPLNRVKANFGDTRAISLAPNLPA